ncbi:MAG: nifS [Bryobacterales bacterium]|nr:nifS [Bryobacterales bacterium]
MLYFDHNATTPVAPEVTAALTQASLEVWGNPSSIHGEGQKARKFLESSRQTVAGMLHCSPAELVFTSGGTESNNLAITGLARGGKHVITTAIEHPAVLETCRQLEREGGAVTCIGVDRYGAVDANEIKRHITPNTILVSVMHANNEVGTLQPLQAIAELIRERRAAGQEIYLHSDGVQAFGKIRTNVNELGIDLYSLSGHKLFAPKGIGALFVRKNVPLRAIQHGGRHERERRAGTENVPGAMAFAKAVELCGEDVSALRDQFEARVLSELAEVQINGPVSNRLDNTSNLLFPGVSGEAMVIALDMLGMAVSSGSACSSGSIEPSHVLLAMGRTREEARSSVRFSFGRYNTPEDINTLARAVVASAKRLAKRRQLVTA